MQTVWICCCSPRHPDTVSCEPDAHSAPVSAQSSLSFYLLLQPNHQSEQTFFYAAPCISPELFPADDVVVLRGFHIHYGVWTLSGVVFTYAAHNWRLCMSDTNPGFLKRSVIQHQKALVLLMLSGSTEREPSLHVQLLIDWPHLIQVISAG